MTVSSEVKFDEEFRVHRVVSPNPLGPGYSSSVLPGFFIEHHCCVSLYYERSFIDDQQI